VSSKHAYDRWADGNRPPLPYDLGQAERDTAVATLKDVLSLCNEGLADAEVRFRVGVIVRASLAALGELPELEPEPERPDWLPADDGPIHLDTRMLEELEEPPF
jgi:hypothetical protein